MNERKAPEIRFKGFTDDWEQRKVGDTCKINGRIGFRGYTEKDIISKEAGGVLTFSPTNIVDNKLTMDCKNTYITREKYDESPEILIKNGDILFVKTGSTLGKSALVTGLDEDASINPQIVVMRVEEGTEAFFSNVLITQDVLKQVTAVRIGGAVPTMTETELKNFVYYEPTSKAEKNKIGEYFSNLDNLITLHQRKHKKLLSVKKSMLEKMFPQNGAKVPEIRFEGFTDDWEQRKFSELYARSSEKNDGSIGMDKNITVATMQFKNDVKVSTTEYLKTYYTFKLGDIAFEGHQSKEFRYGRFVENDIGNGIVSHIFAVFRPIQEYDLYFWKYAINNETLMQRILARSTKASTMMHDLVTNDFLNETFLVPSVKEQKQIGAFLNKLDNLITLHQRELDKLVNIKKSMLEKMFV